MQIKSIPVCMLMMYCSITYAQTGGIVLDPMGKPLEAASVSLLHPKDSAILLTVNTDSAGFYKIGSSLRGRFLLRFSFTGLQTQYKEIILPDSTPAITDILQMQADERTLNEFVVRSSRPPLRQESFGGSIDVAGSILAKGSSLLEVLERSPGILIDHRNQSISLNGKTGVTVMLNGQLLRMPAGQLISILASLPANTVARIDLMSTVPAGMDAEGTGGIIRIVLKQNNSAGTMGSLTTYAGAGWGPKAGATFQVAHNTAKWQIMGSYSYSLDRTYSDLWIDSHQSMPVFGGPLSVLVWDTSKTTAQNHTAVFSLSHSPDTTLTVGVQALIGKSINRLRVTDHSVYFLQNDSTLYFRSRLTSINDWDNQSAGIFLDKRFAKKQTLSLRAGYLRYTNNNPTAIDNSLTDKNNNPAGNNDTAFASTQRGYAATSIDVIAIKADYTGGIFSKARWQGGIKFTKGISNSHSGLESLLAVGWVPRSGATTTLRMQERIAAAYANIDFDFSEKNALSLGFRYEHTTTDLSDSTASLPHRRLSGRLFPSLIFSHTIKPGSQWQLSYNERITRPSYNDLASFVRYSDATAVYTGNPLLLPGISRQLKMGYITRKRSLQLFYDRSTNTIAGYQLTESPDRKLLYVAPQNLRFSEALHLEYSLNTALFSWWSLSAALSASWNHFAIDYTRQPVEHAYLQGGISFTQAFHLPKEYAAELSGWFHTASFNGTVRGSAAGSLSAGMRKAIGQRSQLSVSVSDMLMTQRYRSRYGTITREAFGISNMVIYSAESSIFPIIKLSYSLSFGSNEKTTRKINPAAEENERVRMQ